MKTKSIRPWATKLMIATFILMAGTGILMFFKPDIGLTSVVHQWFSWIFLIGACAHVLVNFQSFKIHLQSRPGTLGAIAFSSLLIASLFSWGMVTGPQLMVPVEKSLISAPLSVLANLTKTTPSDLVARLHGHGIAGTAEQTIVEISDRSGVSEDRLLGIVFLNK